MPVNLIRQFFKLESASGILLLLATFLAIVCNNSPLSPLYDDFLSLYVAVSVGDFVLGKPLLLWINDGFMAVFFLFVGLELKREIFLGQLRGISKVTLPAVAACGGILVPAMIYYYFNPVGSAGVSGWAIPTATDIAFALGVLMLFGSRVPLSLKLFLTALAIIDDIGAIGIITIFHTKELSVVSLSLAGIILAMLYVFNRLNIQKIAPYALLGIILWVCVLKSGIHATLAGVVLGFALPLKTSDGSLPVVRRDGESKGVLSPLEYLEETLHPWVAFMVMPIFAFANAGVSFSGMDVSILFSPVLIGIVAGLFVGKQLGIFVFSWVLIKLRLAKLPEGCRWLDLYAVSLVCGIGFTMSLFIGSLAFRDVAYYHAQVRLGVILGSLISGLLGMLLLSFSLKKDKN